MERVQAVVRAVKMTGAGNWAVYCSECGPIGTVGDDNTHTPSAEHMKKFHGATVVTR